MKISKFALTFLGAIILSACASQPTPIKQTASGYPEGIFQNATVDDVRAKLMEGCNARGILVEDASSNQVVCGKTMEGVGAAFAQMMIGNKYSTTPQQKVRFMFFKSGEDVKVTAQQWMETQMAMGQVRKEELNSADQRNRIQQFLNSLGAK